MNNNNTHIYSVEKSSNLDSWFRRLLLNPCKIPVLSIMEKFKNTVDYALDSRFMKSRKCYLVNPYNGKRIFKSNCCQQKIYAFAV